jgi:signal transduction histidine kinase
MMGLRFSRLSLLWKIVLSTSVAVTVLFALVGWMVESSAISTTSQSLEDEVKASFEAYRSLWKARADSLAAASLILSGMSDVRAAFNTGDQATIRDTAGELWSKVSDENAIFVVTEPNGRVLASLGGRPDVEIRRETPIVRTASRHFPKQASGFSLQEGHLYQLAVTPVYVQAGPAPALLNVLVAGFVVDHLVAQRLKEATGGSEFLFLAGGRVIASTLNERATAAIAARVAGRRALDRVSDGVIEYAPLMTPLPDMDGQPVGQLWILRSFEAASQRIRKLQRNIVLLWLFAVAVGLALTYLLARKIIRPVEDLDRAAAEVARQNYSFRVPVESEDELGRLARTFNNMCDSIRDAREELIRRERITTIGRLSSSIVHDLRNPLAAIYGGAEMLVDAQLSPEQMKRLAGNIYRSSRRIQELLQDLLKVSKGKVERTEVCKLREIASAACESLHASAETQKVKLENDVAENIELPLERDRMERVFVNLVDNALDVMPDGGTIRISAQQDNGSVVVSVEDTGPGIAPEILHRLFQPFATARKKNGLGLGLALSRQTVLDHGGDMWADSKDGGGATFHVRLPVARMAPTPAASLTTT